MPMRCGKTFCALAIALAIGFAAQPAAAQRRGGGARFNAPRMAQRQNARAFGPQRQNRNQAARPGGAFHPPAHPPGQQGHPNNAQGNPNATHPPNSFRPPANPNGGANGGVNGPGANGRQASNLPPAWGPKLRNMSPQQQDRFMQNNERFRSLPPEKQQQIRQNLQKWNNLSPTERMAMKDRQRTWEAMSPEQKQYVQRTLLPKWQQMSPERKQVVNDRLHTLQGMTPEDRQRALNDPQFMRGLNPDEQSVLRGLDSVRNPSNP